MADKKNNIFTLYSNNKDEKTIPETLPVHLPIYGDSGRKFGLLFYADNDIIISKPYANLIETVCAAPYDELNLLYTDAIVRIRGTYLAGLMPLINRAEIEGLAIYEEGLFLRPPDGDPIITSIIQSPYHDEEEPL